MTTRPPPVLLVALLLAVGPTPACVDGNLTHPEDPTTYASPTPEPLPCLPNLDGLVEAHELAPTLNTLASYRVTPPLAADAVVAEGAEGFPVDLEGFVDPSGRRVWDWSTIDPSDELASLRADLLEEHWFASEFPSHAFVVPADAGAKVLGIYTHDDEALWLHGVASASEEPPEGKTLMVYEAPIAFFVFPFGLGDSWSAVGEVRNGWLRGLHPWSQDDTYEVSVDASGELRLPDFTFTQALRVHTKVSIQPLAGSLVPYTQHQQSFVFECFGEVARASSALITDPDEDPGPLFPVASEIRRLGWFQE